MLETHHAPTYYLRPEDIEATLRPVQGSSFCEWKGVARYVDVLAGSATAHRAAWAYENPTIAGWIKELIDEADNERMHLMTFIQIA